MPAPHPVPKASKRPPEPIPEVPPEQKPAGANVQWIPGYWSWDTDKNDYIWVSGFWHAPPPDRRWMAGHWAETDGSWQWAAGFWAPSIQADLPYLPQPPASIDNGPSTPGLEDQSFYVPGTWVFRQPRYVWRPGYWQDYRPDRIWSPARYCWSPAGYRYVDGYWDYCLENRGLLVRSGFLPSAALVDARLALFGLATRLVSTSPTSSARSLSARRGTITTSAITSTPLMLGLASSPGTPGDHATAILFSVTIAGIIVMIHAGPGICVPISWPTVLVTCRACRAHWPNSVLFWEPPAAVMFNCSLPSAKLAGSVPA